MSTKCTTHSAPVFVSCEHAGAGYVVEFNTGPPNRRVELWIDDRLYVGAWGESSRDLLLRLMYEKAKVPA